MRFMRPLLVVLAIAFLVQLPAQAYVKTSPGPYQTADVWGNNFSSYHSISWEPVSGGVYTNWARLYIDVYSGDVLDCHYGMVDYRHTTDQAFLQLTLTDSNTPTFVYANWYATHLWVSGTGGGYVKYINKSGQVSCTGQGVPQMGGWSSAINTSHQWIHHHLSY